DFHVTGVQTCALPICLDAGLAIIDKRRPRPNVAKVMHVIGDERGKKAILVDDLIDTGGTLVGGAEALLDAGAEEVYACATHPVRSEERRVGKECDDRG